MKRGINIIQFDDTNRMLNWTGVQFSPPPPNPIYSYGGELGSTGRDRLRGELSDDCVIGQ